VDFIIDFREENIINENAPNKSSQYYPKLCSGNSRTFNLKNHYNILNSNDDDLSKLI
jgi:hypothetical protein